MKKTVGIVLIYASAVLIMLSILFLFKVLKVGYAYTTAAAGFSLYIAGQLLTKEGKFTPFKIVMIAVSLLLIFVALVREVFG